MAATPALSFDHGQQQVEDMMADGIGFETVEDAIDCAELSQQRKAALWLLAWSLRHPAVQRADARATLAWLG